MIVQNNLEKHDVWIYVIDKNDNFVFASENWRNFARENEGQAISQPEDILGQSLFKFIAGPETKQIYHVLLEKVRKTGKTITFPFRCDAPHLRRFLEMTIFPMEDGNVQFISELIKVEKREPVALLIPHQERSKEFIRMCSMCKKVALTEKEWVEVEEAIQTLKLFEKELLPQITHGLCPQCFNQILKAMEQEK